MDKAVFLKLNMQCFNFSFFQIILKHRYRFCRYLIKSAPALAQKPNPVRASAAAVFANPIYYRVGDERSCCSFDNFFLPKDPLSKTPLKEIMNVKYENIYHSTTRRNFMLLMFIYIYYNKPMLVMQTNHHSQMPPLPHPLFLLQTTGRPKQT